MKPYYLICDDTNHHSFREETPLNQKHIVVVLNLTEPQLDALKKLINEFNQKHKALSTAAEMRFTQKKYYKAKRNGESKFNTNIYLSNALDLEKSFDNDLERISKNFGALYKDPSELNLF